MIYRSESKLTFCATEATESDDDFQSPILSNNHGFQMRIVNEADTSWFSRNIIIYCRFVKQVAVEIADYHHLPLESAQQNFKLNDPKLVFFRIKLVKNSLLHLLSDSSPLYFILKLATNKLDLYRLIASKCEHA